MIIFIADEGIESRKPVIEAARAGLTVFVVTRDEALVCPEDLAGIKESRALFFHAGKWQGKVGFHPFAKLGVALRLVLQGMSLDDLGKE